MNNWLKTHLLLEANTCINHIHDYFAPMQDAQKNEYLQNINDQLQNLSVEQINLRLTELFEAYGLA